MFWFALLLICISTSVTEEVDEFISSWSGEESSGDDTTEGMLLIMSISYAKYIPSSKKLELHPKKLYAD